MSEFAELPPKVPTGVSARVGAGPRLVVDTPILAVLDAMTQDLGRLRRLEPNSGARHALEEYFGRLNNAIREAIEADVWVSTEEAARLRNCTAAAITAMCRQGRVAARKRGGVWEIHKDGVLKDTRKAS
jgi:hypothetical protein